MTAAEGQPPSRDYLIRDGVGVCVVGCGTIGTLRAEILRRHPSVSYLAVCDVDAAKAERLAHACRADRWSVDAAELIRQPEVGAVIVATTEDAHFDPALLSLRAGKHLLVEKPFTIDPGEGSQLIAEASARGLRMYTGFTQRFRGRFLAVKEHAEQGYLGAVTSARASIYLTQAVGNAVMSRAKTTTPAINTLAYCIDLLMWYLPGDRPARVYAQGGHGRFHDTYGAPDSTWAVVTFESGTVASLGVSWELPEFWPAYVASMDVELFGRDGVLSIRDDHREVMLASRRPIPSPYTPDAAMPVAMLGSAMPGDWALGEYFGAMKEETHAFVQAVGTGHEGGILASGRQGLDVLEVARAIDESVATGSVVTLAWPDGARP